MWVQVSDRAQAWLLRCFSINVFFGAVLSLAKEMIYIELELSGVGLFYCLKSQTENCSTAIELTESQLPT